MKNKDFKIERKRKKTFASQQGCFCPHSKSGKFMDVNQRMRKRTSTTFPYIPYHFAAIRSYKLLLVTKI